MWWSTSLLQTTSNPCIVITKTERVLQTALSIICCNQQVLPTLSSCINTVQLYQHYINTVQLYQHCPAVSTQSSCINTKSTLSSCINTVQLYQHSPAVSTQSSCINTISTLSSCINTVQLYQHCPAVSWSSCINAVKLYQHCLNTVLLYQHCPAVSRLYQCCPAVSKFTTSLRVGKKAAETQHSHSLEPWNCRETWSSHWTLSSTLVPSAVPSTPDMSWKAISRPSSPFSTILVWTDSLFWHYCFLLLCLHGT